MMKKIKQNLRWFLTVLSIVMLMGASTCVYAHEAGESSSSLSRYLTVGGKTMRAVLYGNLNKTEGSGSFADTDKTTLVMLPGLGVPSPNLYFKPLAQALDRNFNVVILEPLGYGLSDSADTIRSVDNINKELNDALDALGIDECVLLVHSISGVYGLNFVLDYPEKVKGFIAIDNTIYEEDMESDLAMEQEYMLGESLKFNELRNSFSSLQDFQLAIAKDPDKYGAQLPEIEGYTYPQEDSEEYIQAYARSSNESIIDEIRQMDQSLLTIKGKKFPDTLPVLMMISASNAGQIPAWAPGHQNQLDLQSGNHELYILEGSHYIWYTNLSGVTEQILSWQAKHLF